MSLVTQIQQYNVILFMRSNQFVFIGYITIPEVSSSGRRPSRHEVNTQKDELIQ